MYSTSVTVLSLSLTVHPEGHKAVIVKTCFPLTTSFVDGSQIL